MSTMQQIVDDARVFLNDAAKDRYTDAQLLGYGNEFIYEARRVRPDLFFGSYGTALTALVLADACTLPIEYEQYIKDYVAGRAYMRDEEASADQRAVALIQRAKAGLQRL
jgi:hypothetical protein